MCWSILLLLYYEHFLLLYLVLPEGPIVVSKLSIFHYRSLSYIVSIHWRLWFFWFFPSMLVKDYLPKPSGSCPDFVTLLYLDCHGIFVSDVINFFLDRNFLTTRWIVLLTWGWQSEGRFQIDQQYRCCISARSHTLIPVW